LRAALSAMCKFVANKYSTAVLMGANEKARVVKDAGLAKIGDAKARDSTRNAHKNARVPQNGPPAEASTALSS
jgi:hypothetical protein